MVNPSAVGITIILVFSLLLILLFAVTGHLFANPYGIILILLITIILLSLFMLLAYYNTWWPFTVGGTHNNTVLYISIGVLIISVLLFFVFLFIAKRHSHTVAHVTHYVEHKEIPREVPLNEQPLNELPLGESAEVPVNYEQEIPRTERAEIPRERAEVPPQVLPRQVLQRERMELLTEEIRRTEQMSAVERLALENQLQREDINQNINLQRGSGREIVARDQILSQELKQRNINQDVAEEGVEMARLKDLEATRALRSMYPSREMFGPGGAEDVINNVGNIPANIQDERRLQEMTSERPLVTGEIIRKQDKIIEKNQPEEKQLQQINRERAEQIRNEQARNEQLRIQQMRNEQLRIQQMRNEQMRNERGGENNPLLERMNQRNYEERYPERVEPETEELEQEEVRPETEETPSEIAEPETAEQPEITEGGEGVEEGGGLLSDLESEGSELESEVGPELESGLEEGAEVAE